MDQPTQELHLCNRTYAASKRECRRGDNPGASQRVVLLLLDACSSLAKARTPPGPSVRGPALPRERGRAIDRGELARNTPARVTNPIVSPGRLRNGGRRHVLRRQLSRALLERSQIEAIRPIGTKVFAPCGGPGGQVSVVAYANQTGSRGRHPRSNVSLRFAAQAGSSELPSRRRR